MWNPCFTVHFSISYERKPMSDLSMLVFCFRGHTFVVYLRTTKVHNNSVFQELLYTFYSRNPTCGIPQCLRIFNRKYPTMPLGFHNCEPPLPFGNPKSHPWYSMDIFWNRPLQVNQHLKMLWVKSVLRVNQNFIVSYTLYICMINTG